MEGENLSKKILCKENIQKNQGKTNKTTNSSRYWVQEELNSVDLAIKWATAQSQEFAQS